jgi:hypothetical protein
VNVTSPRPGLSTEPIGAGWPPAVAAVASTRSPEVRVAKNRRASIAAFTPARECSATHNPVRPLPSGNPQSVPCSSVTPVMPVRQPASRQAHSGDERPSANPSKR